MNSEPMVTVLMPVYNASLYLSEALESILTQTFTDFEFLIVDDGSTDESLDIIHSYNDNRIRLLFHNTNQGLVSALNNGLKNSRGRYIARMDADDISLPERLAKQVDFMETHPEIGALGTCFATFGNETHQEWLPVNPDETKCHLLFHSPLAHPSVMLRKSILSEHGINYNGDYKHAEDYHLWVQLSTKTQLTNLPNVLLYYRVHDKQVSIQKNQEQSAITSLIQISQLRTMGIEPSVQEFRVHYLLSRGNVTQSLEFLAAAAAWLLKLKSANAATKYYPEPAFSQLLGKYWKAIWF